MFFDSALNIGCVALVQSSSSRIFENVYVVHGSSITKNTRMNECYWYALRRQRTMAGQPSQSLPLAALRRSGSYGGALPAEALAKAGRGRRN